MRFGDLLKRAREAREWTQPEAAGRIGIEQSYLSKLETGRSYPSEEVFERLLATYELDVAELGREVSSEELAKLREIRQVRSAVLGSHRRRRSRSRAWMVAALVCLMGGAACLGVSLVGDRDQRLFHYRSSGVLQPGEELSTFDLLERPKRPAEDTEVRRALMLRLDPVDLVLKDYRGADFIENVEGGRRFYQLYADREVQSFLDWFRVPALLLLAGSVGCFVIAFRWQ
ncbi:MAG: helix-turn-helix transcriptional regulator [Acidobacteriota bacterium]